jgi:hypothetical protein
MCADAHEHCDLPHRCTFGETTFFSRIADIQKFLCSLVVIGEILLSLTLARIAINRIGRIYLEHVFGVTRHGTHSNNHSDKILHCLVKVNVATQLGRKWGIVLRRKRDHSLGGGSDGMLRDVELKDLLDVFRNESCADGLIQVFRSTPGVPESISADNRFISCRMSFALLLGTVKDG